MLPFFSTKLKKFWLRVLRLCIAFIGQLIVTGGLFTYYYFAQSEGLKFDPGVYILLGALWVLFALLAAFMFVSAIDRREYAEFDLLKVELQLAQSNERYRRLYENELVGLISFKVDDWNIVSANPAILKMFGHENKENLADIHLLADPKERIDLIEKLLAQGNVQNLPLCLDHRTGKKVWISCSFTYYPELGEVEAIVIDITEAHDAEARLAHSLSMLQATLDASQDGILAVDNQQNAINFNRRFFEIWGLPVLNGEALAPQTRLRTMMDQLQDPEGGMRRLSEIYDNSWEYNSFDRLELKDGRVFDRYGVPQRQGEKIVGRVWILRDVTEQTRSEQIQKRALAETQQASATLARTIQEMERRAQETALLNEMSDLLQLCNNPDEAYEIIGRYVQKAFPGISGQLGINSVTRHTVTLVSQWGSVRLAENIFPSSSCWGLRRSRLHSENGLQESNLCQHLGVEDPIIYACIPLTSQGEAIGVLSIHYQAGTTIVGRNNSDLENRQAMLVNLGERISLSLANLQLRETLRQQAIHDPLTGVFNRRFMEMALEREIRHARRQKQDLALIMMDIDYFKRFNDTYGHQAGDVLLREVADILTRSVRQEDLVCRYGGEEFLLILPGSGVADASQRADQIRRKVESLELEYDGHILGQITLSLGVAGLVDDQLSIDDLLRSVDDAMYKAKSSGRNQVFISSKI